MIHPVARDVEDGCLLTRKLFDCACRVHPRRTDRPRRLETALASGRRASYNAHRRYVLLQPDRVGWAKISDNIRKYDEEKVSDVKEDIDVLLVLVCL